MKLLSYIMAMIVLAMATMPCFVEDNCICASPSRLCCEGSCCRGCDDDCSDNDIPYGCCSPFVSCNTCTGVTAPRLFGIPTEVSFIIPVVTLSNYSEKAVKGFAFSVWKPPMAC